jgi:hypothetical protein
MIAAVTHMAFVACASIAGAVVAIGCDKSHRDPSQHPIALSPSTSPSEPEAPPSNNGMVAVSVDDRRWGILTIHDDGGGHYQYGDSEPTGFFPAGTFSINSLLHELHANFATAGQSTSASSYVELHTRGGHSIKRQIADPEFVRRLFARAWEKRVLHPATGPSSHGVTPPKRGVLAIDFWTRSSWSLRIHGDGGGELGYGSSGFDMETFPTGTFSADELLAKLPAKFAPQSRVAHCSVSIQKVGQPPGPLTMTPIADDEFVRNLFERARAANILPAATRRIDQLWRERPPI